VSAALVEARLGRKPQDMLEAAVVLEAWAGIPPSRALASGRALMPASPDASQPSTGRVAEPPPRRRFALEAFALGVSVVATALWAAPLRATIGAEGLRDALAIALPLALGLQWGLSSRYLSRTAGAAVLAGHRAAIAAGFTLLVAAPTCALGATGLVAGLLTVLWTGGTLLIRGGAALVYATAVTIATAAVLDGAPALIALGVLAATIAAVALRRPRSTARVTPGRWDRALCAAAIGMLLGLLLVGDGSLGWIATPGEALLLVPSIVAGAWGSARLWQLPHTLSASLSGVRLTERPGALALGILGRALARTVAAALTLSLLAAELVPRSESGAARAVALTGFGLLAVVTLLASVLESLGRGGWTLAALGAGATVEVLAPPSFSGGALVAGAAVAIVLLLPAAIGPLRRPAVTLATGVWIP